MPKMTLKLSVLLCAVLSLVGGRAEDDNVGGGALEKDAAVRKPSGAAVEEPFGRGVRTFDRGWEFSLGDRRFNLTKVGIGPNENGIGAVLAETNGWEAVDIPHDWMLSLPIAQDGRNGFRAVGQDYPQNSVGWYRKRFVVRQDKRRDAASPEDGRPRVWIQFDGIYRDARLWLNGVLLGRNDSGYIGCRFDVTDLIEYGGAENSLVVRVDASVTEGWWYEGAGIYRHVKLIVKGEDHIRPDSVLFRTLEIAENKAVVSAAAEIEGRGHVTFELDGQAFENTLTVEAPELWSPDAPNLHRLVARLVGDDGSALDEEVSAVGIRRFVFDAKRGLLVNGVPTKVKGVCCHADMGCVGVAVPDALHDYRVKLLKAMGVNADRTCHNPPSPEFLDACDRRGILVLDETRAFSSSDEGLSQLRRLVLRDRNHACVVAFSIGNEEHNVQDGALGERMARRMKALAKTLAPDTAVTYGGNNGATGTGVNPVVDVRGVNYVRMDASVRDGRTFDAPDRYHAAHPDQPMWGSEEASALSTRSSLEDWGQDAVQLVRDGDLSAGNVRFPWATTAEQWWNYAVERDWFAGSMAWTGFDYRGESRWPATVNNFGIMDLCGFPKASYWYYKANWTDEDVLHAWPAWTPSVTNLWIDSNCDEIELSVNGRVVGRQKGDRLHHLAFPVCYKPGEAVLRGTRGGREVVFRMATQGPAVRLVAVADRAELAADGADATVVNLQALDAAGNEASDANGLVVFSCEGEGRIIGVGNGNPLSHEDEAGTRGFKVVHGEVGFSKTPVVEWRRRLFNGKCQAVLKAGLRTGEIRFAARLASTGATAETVLKVVKGRPATVPFKARRNSDGDESACRMENDCLRVAFDRTDGSFSVLDKRNGRTWRQFAEEHAVAVSEIRADGNRITFKATAKAVAGTLEGELVLDGETVLAQLEGAENLAFAPGDANLVGWPCPFATERGDRTLLPHGSGFSFPAEQTDMGEQFVARMHGGSRSMRMGMWGQYRERLAVDGEVLGNGGYLAVVETPFNSVGFYLKRPNGLMAFALCWEPDLLTWGHARSVRYEFLADGGPNEMARRYREEMKRRGYYRLFAEKAKERPHMAESFRKIAGAPSVWYWAIDGDKAGVCRYLRETCGFGDFLFQFAKRKDLGVWVTPEEVKACAEAAPGVLLSEYDMYMDTMDSKYLPLIAYVRPYWSTDAADADDVIRNRDGSVRRGWKVAFKGQADGIGDGIGCATTCEKKIAFYVRKRVRSELRSCPWYNARYFDGMGCIEPFECWNPKHRMSRRECVAFRRDMMAIPGREFGILASTEDGPDYLASVCDYFTCGFSADNDYRVDGGRWMWKIYDGEPPDEIRRGTDEKTRLPIFEMVFHGCSVAYWDWCDYNFKFPKIWWKKDLFNALCGTPPLYFFNEETWRRFRDRLKASYDVTTPVAKATYSTPMRRYRILTPDRSVHRVEYENGVASTVNFGERPFIMSDGYELAPHGHRIEKEVNP